MEQSGRPLMRRRNHSYKLYIEVLVRAIPIGSGELTYKQSKRSGRYRRLRSNWPTIAQLSIVLCVASVCWFSCLCSLSGHLDIMCACCCALLVLSMLHDLYVESNQLRLLV